MSSLKYYPNDVEDIINALNIKKVGKLLLVEYLVQYLVHYCILKYSIAQRNGAQCSSSEQTVSLQSEDY